jgi:hypothetical protein
MKVVVDIGVKPANISTTPWRIHQEYTGHRIGIQVCYDKLTFWEMNEFLGCLPLGREL